METKIACGKWMRSESGTALCLLPRDHRGECDFASVFGLAARIANLESQLALQAQAAAHVESRLSEAMDRANALAADLARVTGERDEARGNLRDASAHIEKLRGHVLRLRKQRGEARLRGDYEQGRAEELLADLHEESTRAARIEAAARECVGGDDSCDTCAEWGHCPHCAGSAEGAQRERCEECDLRVALGLPTLVRMNCDECDAYDEVKRVTKRPADWLCATCRAALEKEGA